MGKEVMRMSDKGFAKVFGTIANVQDFNALLIRRYELLVQDFSSGSKNVPDVY